MSKYITIVSIAEGSDFEQALKIITEKGIAILLNYLKQWEMPLCFHEEDFYASDEVKNCLNNTLKYPNRVDITQGFQFEDYYIIYNKNWSHIKLLKKVG